MVGGNTAGYSLDVFPDRTKQVFPFPDSQEVAFGFVEFMRVILQRK